MKFIGVDLAWGLRGGTGLCVVSDGSVQASTRLVGDDEILAWLKPHLDDGCVVAIDAPLIVTNPTGRRRCESLISRCFGAEHAGAHSSNLGLASFREGVRGARLAEALGLSVDPSFAPGTEVRRAIEVYPHPATVALFDLPSSLKYKAKRGRPLETRRAAFAELIRLLLSLRQGDPPLEVSLHDLWEPLATASTTAGATSLDRLEDEIDAYVCAYIALYYWTYGTARCRVVGDLEDGYILTPVTARHAACLDAASA